MTNKGKYKQYKFENDLDRGDDAGYDANFDLDEYIREQSRENPRSTETHTTVDEETSQFKNAILMFLIFAAAFLWANDWSPTQAWASIFGSDSGEVTSTAPLAPSFDMPEIPDFPVNPLAPGEVSPQGFIEFLAAAQSNGIARFYNNTALQTMYESGVTIEYLRELVGAGITDLTFPAVIAYHESGVTMEYLFLLEESGYLQTLSFPAVIAFFENDVSMEYLNSISQAGFLSEFTYPEVIAYYESGVTTRYLTSLDEAGYLVDFSYPAVLAFFDNGITTEFLDQLDSNGLLDGMSYPEVVNAFNADN